VNKVLILGRGNQQKVVITTKDGNEIIVSVLGIHNNQVRLGFGADIDIQIDREEIYLKKLSNK